MKRLYTFKYNFAYSIAGGQLQSYSRDYYSRDYYSWDYYSRYHFESPGIKVVHWTFFTGTALGGSTSKCPAVIFFVR